MISVCNTSTNMSIISLLSPAMPSCISCAIKLYCRGWKHCKENYIFTNKHECKYMHVFYHSWMPVIHQGWCTICNRKLIKYWWYSCQMQDFQNWQGLGKDFLYLIEYKQTFKSTPTYSHDKVSQGTAHWIVSVSPI